MPHRVQAGCCLTASSRNSAKAGSAWAAWPRSRPIQTQGQVEAANLDLESTQNPCFDPKIMGLKAITSGTLEVQA